MTKTKWLIAGGVLLLGGLAVGAFLMTHEREKREVRVPPSGEARKNSYLALERLYSRMGLETSTQNAATAPTTSKRLIFLTDRRRNFTPEQVERWRSWVETGGHLVLPTAPEGRSHVPALEPFDIRPPASDEGTNGSDAGTSQQKDTSEQNEPPAETSEPENETEPSLDRTFVIEPSLGSLVGWRVPDSDWRAGSADGELAAVSRRFGEGRVTLVADPTIFENESIDKKDHARLVWAIATLEAGAARDRSGASIVLFSAQKWWIAYVVRHTWPFFVILGLILLAALNGARWRFGSLLPEPAEERRSRVEHIRATGEFLWEHGNASELLAAARTSLLRRLSRRRPSLEDATGDQQRAIVAEMLDLDRGDVEKMFDDRDNLSKDQFQERIEWIERQRRDL